MSGRKVLLTGNKKSDLKNICSLNLSKHPAITALIARLVSGIKLASVSRYKVSKPMLGLDAR